MSLGGYALLITALAGVEAAKPITHNVGGASAAWTFGGGYDDLAIAPGDRVAQLLFAPVTRGELIEVAALEETARGVDGFGSTGDR